MIPQTFDISEQSVWFNLMMKQSKTGAGGGVETLPDYIRRVMRDKDLTFSQVAALSNNAISQGHLNDLVKGNSSNPTVAVLKGLARGLGVSEDEIFAVARGKDARAGETDELAARFYTIGDKVRTISASPSREELRSLARFIDNEVERVRQSEVDPRPAPRAKGRKAVKRVAKAAPKKRA